MDGIPALLASLHKLEELLKGYSPIMSGSTERAVEKAIKYGVPRIADQVWEARTGEINNIHFASLKHFLLLPPRHFIRYAFLAY